ncbi:MAG: 4-(cytidine 5'-diphospho)-2-C-methyl-D-erythritol kinase [Clostridiales bacterium]|nr:4-(cytidine 5'-diphospho)-2-C-methyl-D-erythritol kinase [Clostridiales bacterium]MBS5877349.1 4-(cytidine 5'-diphospho)-2-C-methyl-D-erythritol kinase [Clostridiales bacterium]MDU0939191.1 4-(cytidine 5'-diphospho)-2-C-methyl-D-erythritol kinase [Clostridiales bacterium]MDU1042164.1 4-(cytidine 5'-diphospho)-2-C-methyl-D-erythritol kinase [Clostridiales bacterium]MDU3490261.1 4-(cytidine 5'-diphospho)-2-C-methyl-D-erythritol kinase [Clostridiales bacterium]
MDKIEIRANAKINLGLDVCYPREDGYHEVKMVMHSLDLSDRVTLERRSDDEIHLITDDSALPTDHRNLAVKAANAFISKVKEKKYFSNVKFGVNIFIEKNIPKEAGLAGGSTDAAAVINGMDELFSTALSAEKRMDIGAIIGSDVPYCVVGGTALATGRGEKIRGIRNFPDAVFVLVKPKVGVSTGQAYNAIDSDTGRKHPDIDGLVAAIEEGKGLNEIAGLMENSFERVIIKSNPVVGEIKKDIESGGAVKALMSGSGPTVYGIFPDERAAKKIVEIMTLKYRDAEVFMARSVQ